MTMMPDRLKALEPFWGVWYLDHIIGEGSYGKVFQIHRADMGETYFAALKWISLPKSRSELDEYKMEGMRDEDLRKLYRETVNQLREEIVLMNRLRGNSHVVSYDDHLIVEHKEDIGWEILIRMELLTPLPKHFEKGMTVGDVIKLGLDICDGLTLCGKVHIIHRDIKPDNIFMSEFGEYKLGDFGVARRMEQTMTHMSRQGTPTYMAPEVYLNKGSYDATVDLYSLGMVMHRMLNRQRLPFLSMTDSAPTHAARNMAMETRLSGVPIPPPVDGGIELAKVICKACAFQPQKRYPNADEMRSALTEAARYTNMKQPLTNNPNGAGLNSGRSSLNRSVDPNRAEQPDKSEPKVTAGKTAPQKGRLWLAGFVSVCALILIGLGIWMSSHGMRDIRDLFTAESVEPLGGVKTENADTLQTSQTSSQTAIRFPNAQVEAHIRKACAKATGDIYPQDVEGIQSLNLQSMGLSDIGFLQAFTGLRELILSGNQIVDISPLANLSKLTLLYLVDNQITDLTPLSKMTEMYSLSFDHNPISSVTVLSNIKNLEYLNASNTQVTDITPLIGLPKLRKMSVNNTPLTREQLDSFKAQMPGATVIDNASGAQTADKAGNGAIIFPNAQVEAHIRKACAKATGDIYPQDVEGIQSLDLHAMSLSDVGFLQAFINLRGLILSDNQIVDISPLSNLSKLMLLYLGGNRITDLTPLEKMTELYSLTFDHNPINSVSVLSSLESLQSINASDTQVADITPLIGLPKLKSLYLMNTPLTQGQLDSFKLQMPGTTLSYNAVATQPAATVGNGAIIFPDAAAEAAVRKVIRKATGDIYPKDILPISTLDLKAMNLDSIDFLQSFTNLRALYLPNNSISDISPLEDALQLAYLDLDGNQITDITPLAKMKYLSNLSLDGNPVNDLSILSTFRNLQTVNASNTQVTDITPLVGLNSLTTLYVRNTLLTQAQIDSFKAQMPGTTVYYNAVTPQSAGTAGNGAIIFPNAAVEAAVRKATGNANGDVYPKDITGLDLSAMDLENIDFLHSCLNLQWLNLSNNNISDISALANLRRMVDLDLTGNQVTDLTPLKKMTVLNALNLENNPVNNLSALVNLPELHWLNASKTDISDLTPLLSLPNLKTVYINNTLLTSQQVADFMAQMQQTTVSYN